MLLNRISVLFSFFLVLLIARSLCCYADDLDSSFEKRSRLDPQTRTKLDALDAARLMIAKQSSQPGHDSGLEGVVQRSLLWDGREISVCFLDGEPTRRAEIAATAQSWTDGTGIRFNFGDGASFRQCSIEDPSDIRVSFEGRSSFSEVGTKARFIPPDLATMKLGGMGGQQPLSEVQRGRVLHEFGHALGFEHEHQSPSGGCDGELNWNYLYAQYGGKTVVDRNIRSFFGTGNMTGIYASSFDPRSIMIYSLPKAAFVDSDKSICYVERRSNVLSSTDVETARRMYPEGGLARSR